MEQLLGSGSVILRNRRPMARPQVFISSTFYDLRHIRASLEGFIERLGYEPVLSEKGRIAYDPDITLDESCFREAASADIFVLIIGGRYGSAASDESLEGKPEFYERYESITKREFEAAVAKDTPTYILVDRAVFAEFETFCKNRKNSSIEYAHVDSVNVFHFIDDVLSKRRNNPLQQFDRHADIEEWLREQWAGLFRELITRRSETKQLATLSHRVEELSSINSSLQRYLEAVVSRVSETPEEANAIIREEKERQDVAKRQRDFARCDVVTAALRDGRTVEQVEDVLTRAQYYDDVVSLFEVVDDIVEFWRDNAVAHAWFTDARALLGLGPLQFKDPPKEAQEATPRRSRAKKKT